MGNEVLIIAKFPGMCSACKLNFEVGTFIRYHTYKKTSRHVKCPPSKGVRHAV